MHNPHKYVHTPLGLIAAVFLRNSCTEIAQRIMRNHECSPEDVLVHILNQDGLPYSQRALVRSMKELFIVHESLTDYARAQNIKPGSAISRREKGLRFLRQKYANQKNPSPNGLKAYLNEYFPDTPER